MRTQDDLEAVFIVDESECGDALAQAGQAADRSEELFGDERRRANEAANAAPEGLG